MKKKNIFFEIKKRSPLKCITSYIVFGLWRIFQELLFIPSIIYSGTWPNVIHLFLNKYFMWIERFPTFLSSLSRSTDTFFPDQNFKLNFYFHFLKFSNIWIFETNYRHIRNVLKIELVNDLRQTRQDKSPGGENKYKKMNENSCGTRHSDQDSTRMTHGTSA